MLLPAGVDEDVIISVLVRRSNEQRQKIKAVYEASTGKVSGLFITGRLSQISLKKEKSK